MGYLSSNIAKDQPEITPEFDYAEGVEHRSPGSRSAPWVTIPSNPYAEGVTQFLGGKFHFV